MPRTRSATGRALRGVTCAYLWLAWKLMRDSLPSAAARRRSRRGARGARSRGRGRLRLPAGGVAPEDPRRRELAELVADHVLGHEHAHVLLAVVHEERLVHEVRDDRRTARPRLDRVALPRALLRDLREELGVDERPLLDAASHGPSRVSWGRRHGFSMRFLRPCRMKRPDGLRG